MARHPAEDGERSRRPDPRPLIPAEGDDSPETQEEIERRAALEANVTEEREYGELGRPFSHRSPFYVGLVGALGVGAAFLLSWIAFSVRQILLLLLLSLFVAIGLDPVVRWLQGRGLPRWAAVIVVLVGALVVVGSFLALAVPAIANEITQLAHQVPHYLHNLRNKHTFLGKLNSQYHLQKRLENLLTNRGTTLATGILGVGKVVVGLLTSVLIVIVLSIYFLADLPRIRRGIYRLAPRSRRARTVLLTDEIFGRVGGYVLGNILTSVIAGLGTLIWAEIFGIPYPVLLGFLVALFDLVPIVGSTVGGLIVSLVALAVSIPVAAATAAFYIVYRVLEDYLVTPRIMGATVKVPAVVTVVAVLLGGAVVGIIGALIAIPIAAALQLVLEEVTLPRLEQH